MPGPDRRRLITPESIAEGFDKLIARFDSGGRSILFLRQPNGLGVVAMAEIDPTSGAVTRIPSAFKFRRELAPALDRAVQVFAKTLAPND